MAKEKKWKSIGPLVLVADGGSDGKITVVNTSGLHPNQSLIFKSASLESVNLLEVKKVLSKTEFLVGPKGSRRDLYSDMSVFTVLDSSTVFAPEQERPNIPPHEIERSEHEEEPVVARRVYQVDHLGDPIGSSVNNPLKSAIVDGEDQLEVNSDGSINVNIVESATDVQLKSNYNEINSVPGDSPTQLVVYQALVGKISFLHKVFTSGNNIAEYIVKVNGTVIDKGRTYFGGNLDKVFDFSNGARGKLLSPGDIVSVEVTHSRPNMGQFNGRIQYIEI